MVLHRRVGHQLTGGDRFVPCPCQVRAGNQKGRVERATRYVRESFWAGRRFTTLAEWQALVWRDQVAHRRRWPGDDSRTVAEVFAEEKPRLLPKPAHPFSTDLVLPVRAAKTIHIRFDLNDYSIPPEAVGRQLTIVASDTQVRILGGTAEIARHHRTYDRHQLVLDLAHRQALLKTKRKAFDATPGGRLALAAPESKMLLGLAFVQGESDCSQTAQLLKLLDLYGPAALRRAINEALERYPAMTTARDVKSDLTGYLCELPLPAIHECFEEKARQADRETLSYEQYLLDLAERECHEQRENRIALSLRD
jgi:hypothetical protein